MKDYIEERTIEVANYIIENKCTVRAAATHFNISKSTIHKDISERLAKINKVLYSNIRDILDENKSQRHIRGGNATREKYLNKTKKERGE